jgi:hypothetical protein
MSQVFLGRVVEVRTSTTKGRYRYAQVEPLVESDEAASRWLRNVSSESRKRFPTRGYVHWHEASLGVEKNSLWEFGIVPKDDGRGDRFERFQLADERPAVEVIDLRRWRDDSTLRSTASSSGLPPECAPLGSRAYLWIDDSTLVGPVKLVSVGDRWRVTAADASAVERRKVAEGDVQRITIDHDRLFLRPQFEFTPPIGYENWATDAEVARSVIRRLQKIDKEAVAAIGVTERSYKQYIDAIESSGLTERDRAVDRARAERLACFLKTVEANASLLEEAATSLIASDKVQAELQPRIEAAFQAEKQKRRVEVEEEIQQVKNALAVLQKQLGERKAQVQALDKEGAAKAKELDAMATSFEAAFRARIEHLASTPAQTFADVKLISELAGRTQRVEGAPQPIEDAPALAIERIVEARRIDTVAEIRVAIGKASLRGTTAKTMLELHAAFASGLVPLVLGDGAYDSLRNYADVICGGQLTWIPVSATMLEAQDIVARVDHAGRGLVASSNGLYEAICIAALTEEPQLVVLEGINRAPVESLLIPWLESRNGAIAGDRARAIPLSGGGLTARIDGGRRTESKIVWPSNLLVACLPTVGVATLPLSADFWRFGVTIEAGEDAAPAPIAIDGEQTLVSSIGWKEQTVAAAKAHQAPALLTLLGETGLSRNTSIAAERMVAILCSCGISRTEAIQWVGTAMLASRVAMNEKAVSAKVREASFLNEAAVRARAGRLRPLVEL